jgi:hypothetical protein
MIAAPASSAASLASDRVRTTKLGGQAITIMLGVLTALFLTLAVACAAYLLVHAYFRSPNSPYSDFEKVAVAALIAVVGTGLTASVALYSATRQSDTAFKVELLRSETSEHLTKYNEKISKDLADMKASSDKSLTEMKATSDQKLTEMKTNSDEALTRLKAALDTGQIAYRELFGTASIYFHGLRSIAFGKWDEERLNTSETAMVSATRHLIYVKEDMRDAWFDFWQRGQDICRDARKEPDEASRPNLVKGLIEERETNRRNFRDLHDRLEGIARSAIESAITG